MTNSFTQPIIHFPFLKRSIAHIGQKAVNKKSAAARLDTKISVTEVNYEMISLISIGKNKIYQSIQTG